MTEPKELTDFSDLRIVALQSDMAGCGHYRVHYPVSVLGRHGAKVYIQVMQRGVERGGRKDLHEETFLGANTVLIQRATDPAVMEMMAKVKARQGDLTVIYEADDDLMRLDPKNPAARQFTPELCRSVEKIVRECDALFVSTPELAARWANLNSRVFVLPNSIDFSFRPWHVRLDRDEHFKDKLIIGWAGGLHHFGDEEPLVPVMRDILTRYDHVALALCSNHMTMDYWLKRFGIVDLAAEGKWWKIDPTPFHQYPMVLSQFDIGLAPLAPTTFNMCKSELRLLEYGAHSIPYVASNIAPYARFNRETGGLGGYLCSTAQEWRDALCRLIEDHEQRAVMSAAIGGIVKESYNTDQVGLRWGAAIREVKSGRLSVWSPRQKPGRNEKCPCQSGKSYKRCCLPAFG